MRYAFFETIDQDYKTPQQIGMQIEMQLEKLKYQTLLPTDADWGYVFSIKLGGLQYDISIISIKTNQFGLSVEFSKNLIYRVLMLFSKDRTKEICDWINEILGTDVVIKRIEWHTKQSWTTTFKKDFWVN
jgi:hypothetical protein